MAYLLRHRRQRGIGLAELVIAMAVSAALLLLGDLLLLSANAAWTAEADGAAIDAAGRFALDSINSAIGQAGYIEWEGDGGPAGPAVAADTCCLPPALTGRDALTLPRASSGTDGALPDAVNGSDILAVRFDGARGGGAVNCAGFGVDAGADGWSIFYIGRNGAGDGELRCKYRGASGWGADAIVDGVDAFQVLYGIDSDLPPDGVPNEFVNASVIDARDAALALAGGDAAARLRDLQRRTHWKQVVAVRIALLLHGAAAAAPANRVFDLFGASYSARFGAADTGVRIDEAALPSSLHRRQRRLWTATFALRNAASVAP
ncbi:PilW family protein [Massilia sp. PWRC2]|uniref:PilW family protein n=1 Tax=Massilia sp. PWRC2 TaxID=2804626 RepID=UPI003CF19085